MHAWSEVEHDLVYKPTNGTLSDEEYAILDELNGLVLAGEIALERLQFAGQQRIKQNEKYENQYDLASYLDLKVESPSEIGNVKKLYYLMNDFNITLENIDKYLLNVKKNKVLSEQLIDMILHGDITRYNKILKYEEPTDNSLLEKEFIDKWANLEEKFLYSLKQCNANKKEVFVNDICKKSEINIEEFRRIKQVRNQIVHGQGNISKMDLLRCIKLLDKIILTINVSLENKK